MKYSCLFWGTNPGACVNSRKILSSPPGPCVTLGRLLKGIVPHFPYLLMGTIMGH